MKTNNGDIIIFPTDTVYGVGARIDDLVGCEKIYELKKRPKEKRLAVLCPNLEAIEEICYVTEDAKKLIDEFMPGALTVILKTKESKIGVKKAFLISGFERKGTSKTSSPFSAISFILL